MPAGALAVAGEAGGCAVPEEPPNGLENSERDCACASSEPAATASAKATAHMPLRRRLVAQAVPIRVITWVFGPESRRIQASKDICPCPSSCARRMSSSSWNAPPMPDALDLLLICVESGMSIEAAIQKVSQEIGSSSIELAEELSLLSAELSYLPDRRMAYENLGRRTNHPGVKSVAVAMTQAETYGTPLSSALRVMAKENRELRLSAAEKKAEKEAKAMIQQAQVDLKQATRNFKLAKAGASAEEINTGAVTSEMESALVVGETIAEGLEEASGDEENGFVVFHGRFEDVADLKGA